MSINKVIVSNNIAKLAAVFIEAYPDCRLQYGFDPNEHHYVLMIEGTGLYLRDLRSLLPEHINLKYGNTQDTIIIIDTTDI